MKSVRVWMVLGALEPLGTVLAADPREEALEAEEFEQTFRLLLASVAPRTRLESGAGCVSEIESVVMRRLARRRMPPAVGPAARRRRPRAEARAENEQPDSGEPRRAAAAQSQTIRVDVSRLDSLLNLVGELVIERTQVHGSAPDLHRRYPRDERAAQLLETTHRIARITGELQDQIMKTRMLPIDGVFQRMPRMVRDLAQKTGKDVRLHDVGRRHRTGPLGPGIAGRPADPPAAQLRGPRRRTARRPPSPPASRRRG